ncbi:SDR family oxidoreductase [Actinoallomurus rhizosphaericola]|uniref:SDR family oxidoreductase n=1 Tax=Actinoallomurus rhizosphaericola TaxID=2952536 RepID=UPI002093C04C|nr:SDR family oxidoreductase [Actinoallomurus rhizosphaericola]MCO5998159.1 SDR family oxidoreductase [Actinoallomurus rhizosphaericola]
MIIVTGATGQLGRLVIDGLLEKVPADQVVAAVRSPEKAADLAARGVQVREADYDRPETLRPAFEGGSRLLLISGSEVGRRVPQHAAAVQAAQGAGVPHIVYTSAPHADTSVLGLAAEHKATEEIIRETGLTYTLLRNNWYSEMYVPAITQAVETGAVIGGAGDGRIGSATRADYAAAAVAVLTGPGHENRIYELAGDVAWSLGDLAAEISRASGKEVVYRHLPAEEHRAALIAGGVPEAFADVLVDVDRGIATGALADTPGDLKALIGRPTTPIADTVAAALAG